MYTVSEQRKQEVMKLETEMMEMKYFRGIQATLEALQENMTQDHRGGT